MHLMLQAASKTSI